MHRLMALGRQIDDREPAVPDRNALLFIDPASPVVRPTMRERIGQPLDERRIASTAGNQPNDTAHQNRIPATGVTLSIEDTGSIVIHSLRRMKAVGRPPASPADLSIPIQAATAPINRTPATVSYRDAAAGERLLQRRPAGPVPLWDSRLNDGSAGDSPMLIRAFNLEARP
jgi:hypothetical protein